MILQIVLQFAHHILERLLQPGTVEFLVLALNSEQCHSMAFVGLRVSIRRMINTYLHRTDLLLSGLLQHKPRVSV